MVHRTKKPHAKKHRAQNIASALTHVVTNAEHLAGGLLATAVPMVINFATPLAIIVGIGLATILTRELLIVNAPSIASHAATYAAWATGIQDVLAILADVIKGVIWVIVAAVDAIRHHATPPPPSMSMPHHITTAAVITFADNLGYCGNTTTGGAMRYITQSAGHSTFCPILRAATPLRWINTSLHNFDWLSFPYQPMTFDGAGTTNCEIPDEDGYTEILCTTLRAGNIVVEIMLPIAIGVILLVSTFGQVCKFAWSLLNAVFSVVLWLLDTIDVFD